MLDLVAETFARALERREQFDPQRGSAVVWLSGIANHLFLDSMRRGRVADESRRRLGMERIHVEDDQLEPTPGDQGIPGSRRASLNRWAPHIPT
jgi:DNA-directed RNA polymerase specialized sigma24 family protein